MTSNQTGPSKANYGWDAPYVARNLVIAAIACVAVALLTPAAWHFGKLTFLPRPMFYGTALLCGLEFLLFVHYVFRGKFIHKDFILSLHDWKGNEDVLDVGCGRGLLLVGVAKRLTFGHAVGLDIWSKDDLSGNSAAATERNLVIEGVQDRCSLVSEPAQSMPFSDESFDIVVSNVCLHNIYDPAVRARALAEITRVLRPGGRAMLSDYKLTREYASTLEKGGMHVRRRWGSFVACFPPMRVVIAEKPLRLT